MVLALNYKLWQIPPIYRCSIKKSDNTSTKEHMFVRTFIIYCVRASTRDQEVKKKMKPLWQYLKVSGEIGSGLVKGAPTP